MANVTVSQSVNTAVVSTGTNAAALATHTALPNPHSTAIADLGVGTLAELNGLLTDAILVGRGKTFQTVAEDFTLIDTLDVVLVDCSDAAVTITVPAASTIVGQGFKVKKIDVTTNTLTLESTSLIDGSLSVSTTTPYTLISIFSDGSAWHLL